MKYKNNRKFKKNKNYEQIKWLLILSIFITTIIINYFLTVNYLFTKIITLTLICLNIILIFITKKCNIFLQFFYESKNELQKIEWPSKKETFYTTLIILIITLFVSLILWILDNILLYFISFIIIPR